MQAVFAFKDREERALWLIAAAVVAAHALFFLLMTLQLNPTQPQMATPRRVVVKTISLQPKEAPTLQSPAATPQVPAKAAAEPKAKPQAKKDVAKAAKKEAAPAAAKAKKEEKTAVSKESISKIQANLSKINTKSLQDIPAVDVPSSLVALAVDTLPDPADTGLATAEAHYRDELARRLRTYLTMPERGEVVIRLTLDRSGSVVKMTIVSAANQANKKYAEQKVPGLTFPGFGVYFGGESQHTFTIALRSE